MPTSKWGWPWEESQILQPVSAKFILSLMKRGFRIFHPCSGLKEDFWCFTDFQHIPMVPINYWDIVEAISQCFAVGEHSVCCMNVLVTLSFKLNLGLQFSVCSGSHCQEIHFGHRKLLLSQIQRPLPTATSPCCLILSKMCTRLPYTPRTIQLQPFYMMVVMVRVLCWECRIHTNQTLNYLNTWPLFSES